MKNFSLRLPEEQRAQVAQIAKVHGLKPADVLRLAVRNLIKSEKRKKAGRDTASRGRATRLIHGTDHQFPKWR